jgi:predicted negative regulator of RcsB-dependent stress response
LADYLTEQEQIQQLKSWVKNYGFTVLLGIAIALLISSGWRFWQNRENKILTHASEIYDRMITMRSQNDTEGAATVAQKLLTRYAKTPYSQMAAMLLARDAVIQKDYTKAKQQLNWVIEHSNNAAMRTIAQIRISRILINEKKPDEALKLLNKVDDRQFIGLVDEVRGDAYLLKNDKKAAHDAYQLALKELPNAEISRPILEMKFNNLAM